jgi:hypothetical protein
MLSLYLFACAYEEKQQRSFAKYLYLSVSAGSLAVLANFAFLNYYLPLLLASAWLLLSDASLRRFSRSHILAAIALFSASGVFLAVILYKTFQLQRRGRFYFGGKVGFISDTVGSLVRNSLYSGFSSEATHTTIAALLVGLFVALLLLGLYLFFLRKETPLFVQFLLILASAAVLPILQHRLVHTLFPIARAALYYLPLYAVALLTAFHSLARLSSRRWGKLVVLVLPAAIAAILSWQFYRSFSLYACACWVPDRNVENMLETLDRDRQLNFPGRAVNLCSSWEMNPSLNFYRIARH